MNSVWSGAYAFDIGDCKLIVNSMRIKFILFCLLAICAVFTSCKSKNYIKNNTGDVGQSHIGSESTAADTLIIAFGSCSDEDKEQTLWDDIVNEKPSLWIWLGDNIYGDTEDMSVMSAKYQKQKTNPGYQELMKNAKIAGVWDDHDYGVNDGGKEYPEKIGSQKLFLDFLDVPVDDDRRKRKGTYHSESISCGKSTIKLLYLDTRYFRDHMIGSRGDYQPNYYGTVLGQVQWDWLENELRNSQADLNIVVSSIQVIAEEHKWEKWSNFPEERTRLLNLLAKYNRNKTLILSGDRHVAEVSQQVWNGVPIVDVTSSSLTNPISSRRKEANKHRLAGTDLEFKTNYGIIEIVQADNADLSVIAKIKTDVDSVSYEVSLK